MPRSRDRWKEPGDAKVQIQSALTSVKETLENAASSMANVLKVHTSPSTLGREGVIVHIDCIAHVD